MEGFDGKEITNICMLSNELLCHILSFLPLKEVLRMGMMNRKLNAAVRMHLMLCKEIDFCQDGICTYMPAGIKDKNLLALLSKCPNLETIRGLRLHKVDRWRLRKLSSLSIPGIIDALYLCPALKRVETNNLKLLESISQYLPQVEIIGVFRNRDGVFPPQSNQQLKLSPFLRITSLHLIGVQVPELTVLPELQYLYLQWVSFTRLHPFRAFSAAKLKTFVMRHCAGPALPLRYYSLFIALGLATDLSRLELVRVPLLGGMINRTVEDVLRERGFQKLKKIVIGDCKGIIESDVGQLIIAASPSLESLTIQASLTKDSLFVSLHFARCDFSRMNTLHLGYIDDFPSKDEWTNDALLRAGLVDVPDVPSSITDTGMKFVSQLFPNVKNLTISNCPHVTDPMRWIPEGRGMWEDLKFFTLERCHCLRLSKFSRFLRVLKNVEVVVLKNMFREPPKGCSHVGLSAGTGLGLSSAVVSTQDEHISVQGNQIEAVQENDNSDENMNSEDDYLVNDAEERNIDQEHLPAPCCTRHSADHNRETRNVSRRTTASGKMRMRNPANCSHTSSARVSPRLRSLRHEKASQNSDELSQPSCSGRQQCSVGVQSDNTLCSAAKKRHRPSLKKSTQRLRSYPSHSNKKCRTHIQHESSSSESSACPEDLMMPSTSKKMCKSHQDKSKSIRKINYSGPITRCRRKMMSGKEKIQPEASCCQSTQTVRCSATRSLSYRASSSPVCASSKSSKTSCKTRRHYQSKEPDRTKKPKMCNKATSTSDPLLEDDVTEIFSVVSEKLQSLTVISCGISHIVVKHSPKLSHLEAQSCRILKCIYISGAPQLLRMNVSQCPKLMFRKLVSEVLRVDHASPLLVYVNPYSKNYLHTVPGIEHHVLTKALHSQCLAVIHDFCLSENDRAVSRESLLRVLQAVQSFCNFTEETPPEQKKYFYDQYPWGHELERVIGSSATSSYEMITNSSLLTLLWKEYYDPEKEVLEMPCNEDLLTKFSVQFGEFLKPEALKFKQFIGFYIHMSEWQD